MTSGPSCSPLHVQNGKTALYIASLNGHDQIVELLLRREADVNHQTKVRLLMLVCCTVSDIVLFLVLLLLLSMMSCLCNYCTHAQQRF